MNALLSQLNIDDVTECVYKIMNNAAEKSGLYCNVNKSTVSSGDGKEKKA